MSGAATSDGEARPNEVTEVSQTAAAGQLRALIERIEGDPSNVLGLSLPGLR